MTQGAATQDDLFVLRRGDDEFYLYAPLRRCVALVNGAAVNVVSRYLEAGPEALDECQTAVIQSLRVGGVLGEPTPSAPVFPADYDFCPHEVTLFLTSRCNLHCRYCYAEAGRKAVEMPWETARAAVDLVVMNAGLLGAGKFIVGFHGGGEPTMAWDLLVRVVDYACEKADQSGLDLELFAATNGILSPPQREFIVKHFHSVNISLDGPDDIQDHQRPKVGGGGSYQQVRETLQHFDQCGFRYGIRATITAATVGRLEEIVEHLRTEFHFSYLHLEPAWFCGRCLTSGEQAPSDEQFIEHFLRASKRGRELNVQINYSGARLGTLTCKFCAAPGDGFSVLPEGWVTSCYEITEPDDPRAEIFHYGRYDASTGTFRFDLERLRRLQQFSVEHLPFCRDCFCKWHCAGDCLAKVFERSKSTRHEGSIRCDLNRALTLASLDELVTAVSSCEPTPGGPNDARRTQ